MLAVGLLLLTCLLFYSALEPLLEASRTYRESIEDMEFKIQRYKKISAGQDALKERLEAIEKMQHSNRYFYMRETAALASADLQKFVKDSITSAHGVITSMQVMPEQDEAGFTRIGIRIRMSGTVEALRDTLYDIETASPMLIIDNLELRPENPRRNRRTRQIEPTGKLNINFEVMGYMRPN